MSRCRDRILNHPLGKVNGVGNSGRPFALVGEVESDFERYQDSARSAKVSLGSDSCDVVNVRVIWKDFFETDEGEETAYFSVRGQVVENIL